MRVSNSSGELMGVRHLDTFEDLGPKPCNIEPNNTKSGP